MIATFSICSSCFHPYSTSFSGPSKLLDVAGSGYGNDGDIVRLRVGTLTALVGALPQLVVSIENQ
jgi:hypothetical protein